MPVTLITPPEIQPVTVAEAKFWLNITASDDDALIAALIEAVAEYAELKTRRQLCSATRELVIDGFPSASQAIELPFPPLREVESVKYLDTDGVEQTLDSALYGVDTDSLVGRVYPAYGESWPSTRDTLNAVRVRYECGWEDAEGSPAVSTVPQPIKTWILVQVAGFYEQREGFVIGQTISEMPRSHVDGLLDKYVVPGVV